MVRCLILDKNTRLQEVFSRVMKDGGEWPPKGQYAFKAYDSSSRKAKNTSGNCTAEADELLEYKAMSNVNIFDMNTEIRNLPCFELELVRVGSSGARSSPSLTSARKSSATSLYSDIRSITSEPNEISESTHTNEYEYIFNRLSASTYEVVFAPL